MKPAMSPSYCRLCAALKPLEKLIDLSINTSDVQTTIANLVRLGIDKVVSFTEGALPRTVCLTCSEQLSKTIGFLDGVERAQVVLKDLFRLEVKQENAYDSHFDDYQETFQASEDDEEKPLIIAIPPKREELTSGNSDTECLAEKKRRRLRKKKKEKQNIIYDSQETWEHYPWQCSRCEVTFANVKQFRQHSGDHKFCGTFKCADCAKRISGYANFLKHVRKHRRYLSYCCHICNVKLETTDLTMHLQEHNQSNQCLYCGEIFESDALLKEHVEKFYSSKKRKHSKTPLQQEDLTCKECSKTFKSRANLIVHQLIHTERRRDHTCEKCGKTFFNKGTLGSHMLLHDDTRPHKCKICGATFKTTSQLRSHVGIHGGPRPYSCEQCGRSFRLRCHLKSHMIIHTDSMPHTCDYCGKSFRFKTILTQHLRQHTGVKPYVCEHCHRDFTNWPNYNKHMKRRHGIDTAKKKHTPDGVFPVNPLTGQVQVLQADLLETAEWKNDIINNLKKPGRPKNVDRDKKLSTVDILGSLTTAAFPKIEKSAD